MVAPSTNLGLIRCLQEDIGHLIDACINVALGEKFNGGAPVQSITNPVLGAPVVISIIDGRRPDGIAQAAVERARGRDGGDMKPGDEQIVILGVLVHALFALEDASGAGYVQEILPGHLAVLVLVVNEQAGMSELVGIEGLCAEDNDAEALPPLAALGFLVVWCGAALVWIFG